MRGAGDRKKRKHASRRWGEKKVSKQESKGQGIFRRRREMAVSEQGGEKTK